MAFFSVSFSLFSSFLFFSFVNYIDALYNTGWLGESPSEADTRGKIRYFLDFVYLGFGEYRVLGDVMMGF